MGAQAEILELQASCGMHPSGLGCGWGGVKIFKKISWEGLNILMLAEVEYEKMKNFITSIVP